MTRPGDSPGTVLAGHGAASRWGAAHQTAMAVYPETGVAASSVRHGSARPVSWTSAVASRGSRGVILVTFSGLTGDQLSQLRGAAIPVVVVNAANAPPAGLPGVGATNWAGCLRTAELLDLPEPPTSIFAGCDEQAFGVLAAARTRGLRVPQDLSVVGFAGLPVTGWSSPPVTTVRQPLAEMGIVAAQMLGDLIDGKALSPGRVDLSTELIVRESTAPPEGP